MFVILGILCLFEMYLFGYVILFNKLNAIIILIHKSNCIINWFKWLLVISHFTKWFKWLSDILKHIKDQLFYLIEVIFLPLKNWHHLFYVYKYLFWSSNIIYQFSIIHAINGLSYWFLTFVCIIPQIIGNYTIHYFSSFLSSNIIYGSIVY